MALWNSVLRLRLAPCLGLLVVTVGVLLLIIAPLVALLYRAVFDVEAGRLVPTAAHITAVMADSAVWTAVLNTVLVSAGSAAVATVVGTVLAWLLVRTDVVGKAVLEQICQVPIFVPPFVGAIGWTLLAAPNIGIFNKGLAAVDIPVGFDVYTPAGMIFVMGIYLAPYAMMLVAGALRSMDPSLEEAAQMAGLSRAQTALRITAPLLAPAIVSSAGLAFTISIGLFGTPVVLGWARQILVLTSRIWIASQEYPPAFGVMAILSIYLMLLAALAVLIQRKLLQGKSYTTVTGKGFRPRSIELGIWRWVACLAILLYIVLTVVAPIAVLLAAALSSYVWSGVYSAQNFVDAAGSFDVWFTLRNSLFISIVAATLGTCIGIVVSWLILRTRIPGRQILEYLVLLPISVPGITFGLGVMLVWLALPLPVYGTIWIIIIAFVGRFSAYAVRSVSASLVQVHPELEESARVFGYGSVPVFLKITLPLIRPAVISGWILLFSFFMTELSMVIILYTADSRTFSTLSFEVWFHGNLPELATLALIQLAIGVAIMVFLNLVARGKPLEAER